MRTKRISEMENYIYEKKSVSLDELMEKFSVSKNTIRRDIDIIVSNTNIKKTYGGVTIPNQAENTLSSYSQRASMNSDKKIEIAKLASEEIENGDVIFVDSGTTTTPIVDFIGDKNVTIITNNIELLVKVVPLSNVKTFTLPGELYRDTLSIVGSQAAEFLSKFNISKCFVSTTGFSIKRGVTNSTPLESGIKETAIANSEKVYLLADANKYNFTGLITYCKLEAIDVLITNEPVEQELAQFCKENKIDIMTTQ